LVVAGAAVVALACGLFVHANAYVWLAAAAVVLIVGIAWPWLVMRTTTARLDFVAIRGREGQRAEATLIVQSRLPWTLRRLRLEGGPALAGEVTTGTHALRWTPTRFGPVEAPTLTCDRPFGLWKARRRVTMPREMLVWPATQKVGPVPDCEGEASGIHAGRRVGVGGEFCGVRDFRPGDRLRLVHWAQTARQDRLVVRETLADATPRVRVGLRLGRDCYDDADAFDETVRDAASKLEGWTRAGSVVEVVLDDRRIACPPNATPRLALDALARLTFHDLPETPTGLPAVDVVAKGHDARASRSGSPLLPATGDAHAA
jgi:uncharacterized protein (DUF58 family)